jgi:hypothetical protein
VGLVSSWYERIAELFPSRNPAVQSSGTEVIASLANEKPALAALRTKRLAGWASSLD